jgi:hypothetical protein
MLTPFMILAVYSIIPESGGYDWQVMAGVRDRLTPATLCFTLQTPIRENL